VENQELKNIEEKEVLSMISQEKFHRDMKFFVEILQAVKSSLLSENASEYGVNTSKNLDIFAHEAVQNAKEHNDKLRHVIDKIEQRIAELLP
jgi:replicative DNA helicase